MRSQPVQHAAAEGQQLKAVQALAAMCCSTITRALRAASGLRGAARALLLLRWRLVDRNLGALAHLRRARVRLGLLLGHHLVDVCQDLLEGSLHVGGLERGRLDQREPLLLAERLQASVEHEQPLATQLRLQQSALAAWASTPRADRMCT